jgi:hypothetical protein
VPERLPFLREQRARDICAAIVQYVEDGGEVAVEFSHVDQLVMTFTIADPDLYHPILARLVAKLSQDAVGGVA